MKRLLLPLISILLLGAAAQLVAQDRPTSVDDVMALVKAGISEDVVIAKIKSTPGRYDTSAEQLRRLKEAGVPDRIVVALVEFPQGSETRRKTDDEEAISNEPKAIVYIYRRNDGIRLRPSVYIDNVEVARMSSERFFVVKLDPGSHEINTNKGKSGGTLELKAGQRYFFRGSFEPSFWKPRGSLELVPRETARLEVLKVKPLEAEWVKNSSLVSKDYPQP